MKKLIYLFVIAIFMSGCSYLVPWATFPASGKEYSCFIGKRYEVVSPLIIVTSKSEWGWYDLRRPENINNEYYKFFTEVPVGTIILADHVSQSGGYWLCPEVTYFIGRFETPGIFKGDFHISSFIEWNISGGRSFCEQFMGMDEKYLRELPRSKGRF